MIFRRLLAHMFALSLTFLPAISLAGAGITYHGRLIDPNGVPVVSTNVQFRLQIRTPGNENCLLYEEIQSKDLSQASGAFALTINDGTGTRLDATGYSLDQIFANRNSFTFAGGNCASGSTYAPNASDSRKIQVLFNDGTFAVGLWEPVPPMAINFVPMAIESMQVGGYQKEQLLKIADGVATTGTELNAAAWTELQALLAGSSAQFIKPGNATFTAAPVWSGTPSTGNDLTNKTYVDAQIAAATLPNVGTAGTYAKVTTDAKGRVTAGLSLVEADLPSITTSKILDGTILGDDMDFTGVVNANSGLVVKDNTGKFNNFLCATAGHVPAWTVAGWVCQPTSISGLTGALAYNSIDNLNFGQVWNWTTATNQHPLIITANALTTGSLLKLTTTSAAVNSNNGLLNVANTGASTSGVLARLQANSDFNSGMTLLNSGRVGIGVAGPNTKLHVVEKAASGTLRTVLEIGAEETVAGTGVAIDFSQGGTVTGRITNIFESGSHVGMGFSTYALGVTGEKVRITADGNVGIGTSLPGATLDVNGHIANSGAAATVGTCGTSPAISGNDMRGVVTLGTGSPTACTVNFAALYASTPICVLTPVGGNPGAVQWWVTPSVADLVISFSASPTASQQFAYHCVQ